MTSVRFTRKPFDHGFGNLVDGIFGDLPGVFNSEFNKLQAKVGVPVNVKEMEEHYVLEVVAPGFEKSDFTINVEENILTVAGGTINEKQNVESETKAGKQIRKEYAVRSFKRSFTLDDKIDATSIEAAYINGVLRLSLPKKQEVKTAPTTIAIK